MSIMKPIQVNIEATGPAFDLYDLGDEKTVTDIRLVPFYIPRNSVFTITNEVVKVDRLFVPTAFFEELHEVLINNGFSQHFGPLFDKRYDLVDPLFNNWLAILDKFGPEVGYDHRFIDVVRHTEDLLIKYAFLKDGDDPDTAVRNFSGQDYGPKEFKYKMKAFFSQYFQPW